MHRYQSLSVWQRSHALVLIVLRATDAPNHPRCRPVFDQLRRAVISIEANVVEGYALSTRALFRKHLRIALGSAAEVECLLNIATELGYLPDSSVKEGRALLDQCLALLFTMLNNPSPLGK